MDHSFSHSTWLLKSKVTAPRQLEPTIRRQNLVEKLNSQEQGMLTLLQAPAGYGKTTSLCEWSNETSSETNVFCWLAVDEDDDAETFLTYLAFSAFVAGIKIEEHSILKLDYGSKRHISRALFSFLAQIERDGRSIKIIIDDGERLSAELRNTVLPLIIRRLPSNATLVIASRETVSLDLSDVEHRGLVRRFGPDELRFQKDEIKSLWKNALNSTQLKQLTNYTQGWPVLNRLLQSAHKLGTFDINLIGKNQYQNEYVTNYIQKKIFECLDEKISKFLIDASILEEITEEVFQNLYGYSFAEALNLSGEMKVFFIHYCGDDSHFKLHPVLREYIIATLKNDNKNEFVQAQKKVSNWYCDHQNFICSVRHARLAEDESFILTILERTNGVFLWLREGLIQFRLIDRMLSNSTINKSVTASFMRSIIYIKDGKLAAARRLYQATKEKFETDLLSSPSINLTEKVVSLLLDVYEGRVLDNSVLHLLTSTLNSTDYTSKPLQGFTLTLQCVSAQQVANFELSQEYGNKAISVFKSMDSEYGELYIHIHLAMIKSISHSLEQSNDSLQTVASIIRSNRSLDEGIKYLKDVVSIEARHEHSPLDLYGADRLMYIAPKLLRSEGWLDIFSGAFRTIAEQCLIHNKYDEARHMLRLALEFAHQNSMLHLQTICNTQLEIIDQFEFVDTKHSRLQNIFFADDVEVWRSVPWRVLEIQLELILIRMVFRNFRFDLKIAKKFRNYIHSLGNKRTATRLSALLCILDRESSCSDLEYLNKHVRAGSFNRSTLFVSKLLSDRINCLDKTNVADENLMDVLATQSEMVERVRLDAARSLILTDEERRILEKLRYLMSDKEIAISLDISHHTVHYHLKKIFAKLNVKVRNEAIDKARQLGIISL